MEEKIVTILNEMTDYLNINQMKKLQETLFSVFSDRKSEAVETSNEEYMNMFIAAKKIEGCSGFVPEQSLIMWKSAPYSR